MSAWLPRSRPPLCRVPRQPPAARFPPPAPPAAAGARANTAFPNSNYLEADFGHFRPLPIRVHDLLDRLVDTPPPSAPTMLLSCGTPGIPTSRSVSAFPITLKANAIRAVGGPRTINPSPPPNGRNSSRGGVRSISMPCEAPAGVGRWRIYPVSHRNLRPPTPTRPPVPQVYPTVLGCPPSLQCPYAVVPEAVRPSDGV
jgi:hypothetical protein